MTPPARPARQCLERRRCPRLSPAAGTACGPAQPPEQLGIGDEEKADLLLRRTGRDIDIRAPKRRFELDIEVKLGIADRRPDSAFLEESFQPLALLSREHDGRALAQRRKVSGRPRPPDERLRLGPTEVDRVAGGPTRPPPQKGRAG